MVVRADQKLRPERRDLFRRRQHQLADTTANRCARDTRRSLLKSACRPSRLSSSDECALMSTKKALAKPVVSRAVLE